MRIKLFPHGRGNGDMPTRYLVRMDYPGRKETPPEILRGDPDVTRDLIDSIDRRWKFSAGVLAWHPDDKVTPEQEDRVMDDFEKVAFAGLEPDQRNILWVRHSHAGHHELHFVVPRLELASGKAFNAFPPGWEKAFGVFRNLHNHREGWARPDDPARARLHTPEHADLHRARLLRWGKTPNKDDRAEAKEGPFTPIWPPSWSKGLSKVGRMFCPPCARPDFPSTVRAKITSPSKTRTAGKSFASREVFMENNGTSLSSLAERLKARTEQETREIESLTRQQFENLNRSLSESSKNALSTTENAIRSSMSNLENEIASRCRIMSKAFGKTCLQAGMAMFGLILALGLMGWVMLSLLRGEAQDLRQEIAALKTGKEAWERDFPPIQRAFPGLALHQQNGKNYLILPEGMKVLSTGTLGSREALEIGRR